MNFGQRNWEPSVMTSLLDPRAGNCLLRMRIEKTSVLTPWH